MCKISIIMPVYNDSIFLDKSINSFLKQTLDDIELICVNDGSSDDSLDILLDFARKFDSIKVLSQENQGSGKARNMGIKEAKGEYIGFLDADDFFIDHDTLEKLYDVGIQNSALMVSGNIKLVDDNDIFLPFKHLDYFMDYGVILPEEYGIPWSFYKNIFKTDFIINNNIEFPNLLRGQDPVFLAEILSKIDKIYTVPTDTYAYFYVNGANQCNTVKKRYDHMMHYKMVFDYLSDSKFDKIRHLFRYEMLGFINMMGVEGGKDILSATREIFSDDKNLLKDFEECFYFTHENDELKDLVEFNVDPHNPRISVIINSEIEENSFKSILNQNFTDFEIIQSNSLEINENIMDKVNGDFIYMYNPNEILKENALKQAYINALYNVSDLIMFKIKTEKFKQINQRKFTFNYQYVKKYIFHAPFNFYRTDFLKSNNIDENNLFKAIFKAEKISYIKKSLGNVSLEYNLNDIESIFNEMDLNDLGEEYVNSYVNYLFNHINSKKDLKNVQLHLKQINMIDNEKYNLMIDCIDLNDFILKRDISKLEQKLESYNNQINKLTFNNQKLKNDYIKIKKIHNNLIKSKSWRITKPLRKLNVFKKFHRIFNKGGIK